MSSIEEIGEGMPEGYCCHSITIHKSFPTRKSIESPKSSKQASSQSRQAHLHLVAKPQFLMSAAVAEFKGPQILGVVRFAQVNMELCRVEANFSGLAPGIHSWSINEFGDLTNGAASTGKIYSPSPSNNLTEPLGDLGKLIADEHGNANFKGVKHMLRVGDLIGRAVVLYEGEDVSGPRTVAAVIARSAGVGENYKKVCSCDGTIIWESSNSDFVKG